MGGKIDLAHDDARGNIRVGHFMLVLREGSYMHLLCQTPHTTNGTVGLCTALRLYLPAVRAVGSPSLS